MHGGGVGEVANGVRGGDEDEAQGGIGGIVRRRRAKAGRGGQRGGGER